MSEKSPGPPTILGLLSDELRWVTDRQLGETFKNPALKDEEKFPILARVVSALEPIRWQEDPTRALIVVMRRAVKRLPDECPTVGRSGDSALTWREIGELLCGFRPEVATDEAKPKYDQYLATVKSRAGLICSRSTIDRYITRPLRQSLAQVLLEVEAEVRQHSAEVAEAKQGDEADGPVLVRDEYLSRVRALFEAGQRLVWLWGEPGTGKTMLAMQAAASLGQGAVLILRAGDSRLLQRDVRDALVAEGYEASSLTDDQCWSALRRLLSGQPRSSTVVVDDPEHEQMLEYLLPRTSSIPVIVTSRQQPGSPAIAAVQIREFTQDQALTLVRHWLGAVGDEEARSLVQLLGARPLALDHALRFLHECPDVSLQELLRTLARSAVRTLENVTAPAEAHRNLVTLYRTILAPLLDGREIQHLLDTFLAITGGYGASVRELLYFFMQSEAGGSFDRLTFRAGLRTLAHYGLVREERAWLVMHSLTFDILRELRGSVLYGIEQDYFWFLLSGNVREYTQDREDGRFWAWLLKSELLAASDLLPGWKCTMCVDRRTWLALRADDNSGSYLARYDVRPVGIYKLDYRTGERAPVAMDEGRQLYGLVDLVHQAVNAVHFPDGAPEVGDSP